MKNWEDDLPAEYRPDFATFGGNKSEEFKKHCFAKYCWTHKDKLIPDHSKTWGALFSLKYKQTVDEYRMKTRELAARLAMEKAMEKTRGMDDRD